MSMPEKKYRQTYLIRKLRPARRLSYYEQTISTLFDELIHKPWGICQWEPPADVSEDDVGYTVVLDLPNVNAEQVNVHVYHERCILIEGQRTLKPLSGEIVIAERPVGGFCRVFEFDDPVDADSIQVEAADGAVTVQVHKKSS